MDRDEDQSGMSGRMRYLLSLLFVWWAFLTFHSSASFCIPCFSSLLRPSRAVVKASGYAARYAGVPSAAFDCLDASLDTLSAYCTLTVSFRQYILWYLCPPCGCWTLEELAMGWMALTERGGLLELWIHVSVFYWQWPLSV